MRAPSVTGHTVRNAARRAQSARVSRRRQRLASLCVVLTLNRGSCGIRPARTSFQSLSVLALPFLAFWCYVSPAVASSIHAVNTARRELCGDGTQRTPLIEVEALDDAAAHLARGESLHSALLAAAYRAAEATAIPLGNVVSEQALSAQLGSRYCAEVTRQDATEVGVSRRGSTLWVVVATPLTVPLPENSTAIRQQMLDLVNAARNQARTCGARTYSAAPPLSLSNELSQAALEHAVGMARTGLFDHVDATGATPADRVRRTSYRARIVGENIAAGMGTAAEALEGWLASPGHCENLMEPRFTHLGTAFATNLNSDPAVYWTLDLAAAR